MTFLITVGTSIQNSFHSKHFLYQTWYFVICVTRKVILGFSSVAHLYIMFVFSTWKAEKGDSTQSMPIPIEYTNP